MMSGRKKIALLAARRSTFSIHRCAFVPAVLFRPSRASARLKSSECLNLTKELLPMPTVDQLYDEAIDLQQAGSLDEAVGKLESLVVEHPDYALAHAALSVFYGKLGRADEAVEHAQRVCQLDPDDPFSFMALSLICQRAGRIPEAEQALGLAMEKQWAAQRNVGG
jgi:Flp pilus assembly protein TadD